MSTADWVSAALTLAATSIGSLLGGTKAGATCLAVGVVIMVILQFTRPKEKTAEEGQALRASDSSSKPEEPTKANLVVKDMYLGKLYLVGDIWCRNVPQGLTRPVSQHEVIFAEIKNAGKHGEVAEPAPKIRAELVVGSEKFTPLPWIDEYYSTVDFKFGDVKYLVLAVGMRTQMPAVGDWRVVVNRRMDAAFPQGVSAIDFNRLLKRVVPESKVRLNLLQVSSGQILNSFEGVCRWTEGSGKPTIYFKRPEGG